jgi:redox-sensitive bicupin YhaK (pirin superfamily)
MAVGSARWAVADGSRALDSSPRHAAFLEPVAIECELTQSRIFVMLRARPGGTPLITIRRAADRGRTRISWLDSRHTFSFGEYQDPKHMGFRALRVINEDHVEPGGGFAKHGHRDMEIVTYVLRGALAHEDSLGTGSTIRPGELQRMSAGTGIQHSEFNASQQEGVHFLQIWILPNATGIAPSYEQREFAAAERQGRLRLVASPDGANGALTLRQDARIYATQLAPGDEVHLPIAAGRGAWVQVASGALRVNGERLVAGDGAAIEDTAALDIEALEAAEALVLDLA